MQASQVVFIPYPTLRSTNTHWVNAYKIKSRWIIDMEDTDDRTNVVDNLFQDDEINLVEVAVNDAIDGPGPLNDPSFAMIEVEAITDEDDIDEDDLEFDSSTTPIDDEYVELSGSSSH